MTGSGERDHRRKPPPELSRTAASVGVRPGFAGYSKNPRVTARRTRPRPSLTGAIWCQDEGDAE